MPVKNKKSKKEKKKKSSSEEKDVNIKNKAIKNIKQEIEKNIDILETEVSQVEGHVFVKKDLPSEEINKNSGVISQSEMTKKLTEIYEDVDGAMPDMQQFQKSKRSRFLRAFFVLIFSALFFATVAWVGLFVVKPANTFSEDGVILTMSGNQDFISGEIATYRIRYKNSQNVDLYNVVLEVRYPKGFVFSSSTEATKDDNHDSWEIGDITAQNSGYIDVTGQMYGDFNDEQSFRIFLNYIPANFSSLFQKVTSLSIKNTESLVKIEIETPEQIVAGLDTPIKIILSPQSDIPVKNISVSCNFDSFSFKSSDPKIDSGKECEWFFESLDATQEINVSGFFSENKEGKSSFQVNVKNWENVDRTGNSYILATAEKKVELSNLDTVFNVVINGTAGNFEMQPGETINATVFLKNNGESILENSKLKFILDAPAYKDRSILSWSSLDTIDMEGDIVGQRVSTEVRRGTITWDKRYISGLEKVMPGDEIKINISLPIKNAEDINLADYVAHNINISSEFTYNLNGKEETIGSNKLDIKLVSDLKMATKDEITQDVEGNTIHKVSWILTNTYHNLKNIEVNADLYGDIFIDEANIVVPAGIITYDKEQKKLVWKIDQMPTSVDILVAQLEIKILSDNPTQKNLTSKPIIKAFDDVLQQDIQSFGQEVLLTSS